MTKKKEERLLKLWKDRQTRRGIDVSGVKTLYEAEHFFDKEDIKEVKKEVKKKASTKKASTKKASTKKQTGKEDK
jgi:hypothetical protein